MIFIKIIDNFTGPGPRTISSIAKVLWKDPLLTATELKSGLRIRKEENFWSAEFSWFTLPAVQTTLFKPKSQMEIQLPVTVDILSSQFNPKSTCFYACVGVEPRWNALELQQCWERCAGLGGNPTNPQLRRRHLQRVHLYGNLPKGLEILYILGSRPEKVSGPKKIKCPSNPQSWQRHSTPTHTLATKNLSYSYLIRLYAVNDETLTDLSAWSDRKTISLL